MPHNSNKPKQTKQTKQTKQNSVSLTAAFDMTSADAVSYFRSKGYVISDHWHEVLAEAHAKAFTIAKAMRLDILEAIRSGLDDALANGLTSREFAKQLTPLLQEKGWWGKQVWVGKNNNARKVQLGSPYRLKNIYRINLQTAFMSGRYRRQLAAAETHPYWMYVAVMDSNTRPEHAALNGRVFHYTDPIWQYLYPPNGWGCRCRIRALSQADLDKLGLEVESGSDYIKTFQAEAGTNAQTGEVIMVDHMRADLPNGLSMSPDIGWAYNPAFGAYGTDLSIAKKLGTIKHIDLRSQLIQQLNNNPLRQQRFKKWASDVLAKRRAGHSVQTVGFMPEQLSQLLTDKLGIEPSRLLVINEKSLIHADSDKHRTLGTALTEVQLLALPQMLEQPEAILIEKTHARQDVLFIYPSQDDKKVKIVVRLDHSMKKQPQTLDSVVNVFLVESRAITDKKKYELIKGKINTQ